MSTESVPQPSLSPSKTSVQIQPSSIKTREDLHVFVRSYCIQHKISLKKLSGDYRYAVQEGLKKVLNVTTLTKEHNDIVQNFCSQVPAFYRKNKSNYHDVKRNHKAFFEEVIVCTASVSFEDVANLPTTE